MNYETFRAAFGAALRDSRLPVVGTKATESLDLHTMDRTHETIVGPIGGQDAEPFFVAASISWRWSALHTARAGTCDEDVLVEMIGRRGAEHGPTERPWVRTDIKLKASLPWGKPLAMPGAGAWQEWARETMARLGQIEPLTPEESVQFDRSGRMAVLAWQGDPLVLVACSGRGDLKLDGVEISAWQSIELPRIRDDPDRPPDPGPDTQLAEMFGRVRAALSAWTQALDHLRA